MRVAVASLIAIGAIAGLAVHGPPWPVVVCTLLAVDVSRLAGGTPPMAAHGGTSSDAHSESASANVLVAGARASAHASAQAQALTRARAPKPEASPAGAHLRSGQGWQLARDIERALLSSDARDRERALTEGLPVLIEVDAHTAAALVERIEPGAARDELRTRVARLWSAADPGGAIDWAGRQDDPDERRLFASDIAAQLATSDPAGAIEIANLFDVGHDDGTIERVVQIWAEEHLDDALAFASGLSPGPARDRLLARVALVQAARAAPP